MPLLKGLSRSRNLPDQPIKVQRDRVLTDEQDAFKHNAWDNVPRPDNEQDLVKPHIDLHNQFKASDEKVEQLNSNPSVYWNDFYKTHQSSFFKDRQWLGLEFPDLMSLVETDSGEERKLLEIGCGAGNALFPLVESNQNKHLHLHGSDYSEEAVSVVKQHESFKNPPNGKVTASVWDLSSTDQSALPLPPNSCDYILMIFVLSALHPDQFTSALQNVHTMLKPGGKVLFRDYGRYDLAQIRMKKNRLLQDHFYCRGDGTRVYFFELEELDELFKKHGFSVEQSSTDRRLIINRKEEKKMYRVWQQATYTK